MTEYQYNVEVKSRFALFLDDSLSNEDPNLLLSRLQKKREKGKKEKVQPVQQPVNTVVKTEVLPTPEVKAEPTATKAVQPNTPKSPKAQAPVAVESEVDSVVRSFDGNTSGNTMRGRGARPPARGFRGGRGQGPRQFTSDMPEGTDEAGDQKEIHYEPRGRGRGRGRGTFTRDRGMHFSERKFDNSNQDRMGNKQLERDDARDSQTMNSDDKVNGNDERPIDGDHDTVEPHENGDENAPAEEEPKIYTLEEYKAMKKLTKPTVVLNTQGSRQANDGKDVFANMVPIHKPKVVSEIPVKAKEPVRQEQQQPIDIVVSFTDGYNNRGRGRGYREFSNRGDRGPRDYSGSGFSRGARTRGGTRGRGRGGFRDRESEGSAPINRHVPPPSLDNDVEFPSLK